MLIISCAYAHDSLRLITMRIRADIIRLRSLYHEKNIATRDLVLIYYLENDRNILNRNK